jgi:hypothetical protein
MSSAKLELHLHDRQEIALTTPATEVLFGGSAGGGKSHLLRVASIIYASEIPGLQVYLFRRIRDDLVKNHMEGPKGYQSILAPWVMAGFVKIVDDEIRFWNGSKIYLCHCKDEKDRFKYQGSEIHLLLVDELTHFSDVIYRFLRGRVRAVGLKLPSKYTGMFPRILCGSNPGNIGHSWVKKAWIDGVLDLEERQMEASEGGMVRQLIRAKLEHNPSLIEDDPDYETRLEGLGSKALVQAMRHGDWDIIEGAFFDEWNPLKHVLKPFRIPDHWTRFTAMDWGSAHPFAVLWFAIVPDEYDTGDDYGDLHLVSHRTVSDDPTGPRPNLPRGALVIYREWYGSKDHNNVGLKLPAEEVAAGIVERERAEPRGTDGKPRIAYRVIDPAAFSQDGGPSHVERMETACKIYFRRADNKRVPGRGHMGGWDAVRSRLKGDALGRPMMYVFENCVDLIRCLPAAQHDDGNPEDIADCEDHCFSAGTLVETSHGAIPIEKLPSSGIVWSTDGWRPYHSARMTRRNAPTVRLTFDNGVVITCTPDHKFLVDSDEWRYAKDLTNRSVLCSQPSSVPPSKNLTDRDITFAEDISNEREPGFISQFGNFIKAISQRVVTSIIKTITGQTIAFPILSVYQPTNISVDVTENSFPRLERKTFGKPYQQHQFGMQAKMEKIGIRSITKKIVETYYTKKLFAYANNAARILTVLKQGIGSALIRVNQNGEETTGSTMKSEHAVSAKRNFLLIGSQSLSIAQGSAVPYRQRMRAVTCLKVEEHEEVDVFCLTVPDTECFAIEGGLIVHNCLDAARYGCMSRPYVRSVEKTEAGRIFTIGPDNAVTINDVFDEDAQRRNAQSRITRIR